VRMVKYWNNNPKHGDLKPVKPSFRGLLVFSAISDGTQS